MLHVARRTGKSQALIVRQSYMHNIGQVTLCTNRVPTKSMSMLACTLWSAAAWAILNNAILNNARAVYVVGSCHVIQCCFRCQVTCNVRHRGCGSHPVYWHQKSFHHSTAAVPKPVNGPDCSSQLTLLLSSHCQSLQVMNDATSSCCLTTSTLQHLYAWGIQNCITFHREVPDFH